MTSLTRDQVGDVLRSLGFNETEAAGDRFFWYEYPTASWERNKSGKPVVRAQFYVPRSELDLWVYWPGQNRPETGRIGEYVFYESNVLTLARAAQRSRLIAIALDQARPSRELSAMVGAARNDDGGARVLFDWLLDQNIDPT